MVKLSYMSLADLRREVTRREQAGSKLLAQRDKIAQQLDALDAELADLGLNGAGAPRRGRKPGRRPGRPRGSKNKATKLGRKPGSGRRGARGKNKLTLPDAIAAQVKVGATVSPADAAAAVKKAGYVTKSKTFGMQVANTLAKHSGFKRLGRGQYRRVK